MIRRKEFNDLNDHVQSETLKLFERAKANANDNDFLLFLSNAQYVEALDGHGSIPYVIDYRAEKRNDSYRMNVLMEYLNTNYSFRAENSVDSHLSISFELMIYCHIWESKPYLKQLYRLAKLTNGYEYPWEVRVPDNPKYPFIKEIREMFENADLGICDVISSSFNSSLRNAFAHSEYNFGLGTPEIYLTNYKGKDHEIRSLSFDAWTEMFAKSFLTNYHFQNIYATERKSIKPNTPLSVILKDIDGKSRKSEILYNSETDSFSGYMLPEHVS